MLIRTLVLALAASLPAAAQIDGPKSVNLKAGRLSAVRLTADVDEGSKVDYWIVGAVGPGPQAGTVQAAEDILAAFREYEDPDGKPDPKAGKRTLRIQILGQEAGVGFILVAGVKDKRVVHHVITVHVKAAPGPDPGPGPGPAPPVPPPDPGPDPPKPTGATWVVVLADQDADSPGVAAVVASEKFRGQLATWGLKFKVYDKSAPAVRDKGYLAHVKDFPALLILDKDGRVILAGRCPEDEAGAIEAVRKGAGK